MSLPPTEGDDVGIAHRAGAGGELGRESGRVGHSAGGDRALKPDAKGGGDRVEFSRRIQQVTTIIDDGIRVTAS